MKSYQKYVLYLLMFFMVSMTNVACMLCGNTPVAITKEVCLTLQDKDGKDVKPDKLVLTATNGTKSEHQDTWGNGPDGCFPINENKVDVEVEWQGETLKKTAEITKPNECSSSRAFVSFQFKN